MGALAWPARCPLQTERLSAEQIKEYKGVFEMLDEEGNGEVKTGELERLMSLLGVNPKSELASMAKDVDRDSEWRGGSSTVMASWARAGQRAGRVGRPVAQCRTRRYVLTNAVGVAWERSVAMMTGESFKLVQ
uniref:EF-hand domain-containing protein n=1 Tax=Propithecus coquereli TaxID=379532 RepID=A0A2K6F118_PROCO